MEVASGIAAVVRLINRSEDEYTLWSQEAEVKYLRLRET